MTAAAAGCARRRPSERGWRSSATATSAPRRRELRPWSQRSGRRVPTSRSPPFALASAAASGSRCGSPRWAISSRCGYEAAAPISGQRAMRIEVLRAVLPFAAGYGMEIGITVDAVRAGYRVAELELDLEHRATGRTLAGFRPPRPPAARLRARVLVAARGSRGSLDAAMILAIDQGTTGTTCLVFDHEGESAAAPTASSPSTSRGRAGSSTTPTRSGR